MGKVIICLLITYYGSKLISGAIEAWLSHPVREIKKDHPLYITKEIDTNEY